MDGDDNVVELRPVGVRRKPHTATAERMRELTEIRLAKIAAGDTRARGGRRRKKLTEDEIRAMVLTSARQELLPARAAALKVLEKQLTDKDSRVAQKAALEILAYTDGKPTQVIEQTTTQTTEVVYVTAAAGDAGEPDLSIAADAG